MMYKINVAHRWMGLAAGVALILALVLWWPGQVRASGAPDAPTDLSGAVVSEGIELEWVAPAGDVTGYQILRRRPEEGEKSLTVYEQDTGTTGTVYTDTAVKDEVRYVYRVRSLDEGQQSDPSNFVNIRWEEPPPGPPSNLEGENTALGVALTWQAPTGDEEVTGYQLLRRRPDDDGSKLTDYASTTGSDATSYTDIMVEEGTRYVYRVRAVNEHGESAKSQFINIVRRMPAPGVPTALAAASGADGVELTWEKPTGGGTLSGYEVLRRIPARDETDLVLQATIPESDVTLYVDENVEDGVKYIYRVRGIRGSVMGPISNRAVVRWEEPAEPESEEEPEQAESQPASEDDDDPVVFVAVPDMGMLVTFAMDPEPILEENGRDIAIGFSNVEPGKVHNIQFMAYDDDDKATRSCLGSGLEGGLALNLGTWTETYTHDVEIATTCPVGMYELVVAWTIGTDVVGGAVVHKFEVIENPDAGTEEDDPSLEYTDYVVPVRPTPAATHGPMLVGFVHSPAFTAGRTVHVGFGVGGLEFDDDVETTDYVVSFRVVDKDNQLAPECGVESLGGSYLLKTVKHHGMWARNFVISGSCTAGGGTAKLRMELLNGNHEYLGQFELTVR